MLRFISVSSIVSSSVNQSSILSKNHPNSSGLLGSKEGVLLSLGFGIFLNTIFVIACVLPTAAPPAFDGAIEDISEISDKEDKNEKNKSEKVDKMEVEIEIDSQAAAVV